MKNRITLLVNSLLALGSIPAVAGPPQVAAPPAAGQLEFVANRRQWDEKVLFAADVPAGRLYLEQGRLVQALYDGRQVDELHHESEVPAGQRIRAHAYSTTFVGASPATVQGEGKLAGYSNYFLGSDQSRWAREVPGYGEVWYRGLYKGVDLHFYSKERKLEYDFEVAAGADASRIALRYAGQTKLTVVDGALHIGTTVGTVVEQQPYAYQVVDGQPQRVPCEYVLGKNHTVSFVLPKGYNHALPLVIDPVLVYSSYTGSSASNYGYTAAYDSVGNLYTGGVVFSSGYPTTVGAYDVSFASGRDMGLMKFNPSAATAASSRVYATYVGGNGDDHPHSLVVDRSNNLIVLGSTASSDYPTTASAYDRIQNGTDIVVTKLNAAGSALVGSTYLGGTGTDGQLSTISSLWKNYGDAYRGDITLDRQGNIYLTSVTESTNFPVVGGFQTARSGTRDAVVVKLNPALTNLVWSTLLGGSTDDTGYSIQLDSVNNVFVSGGTTSTDLPGRTGAFVSTYQGAVDGFVSRISPDGTTLVRSTYLGTTGYDQAHFVQLNRQGEVYAFGQTLGSYPVTPGKYANPGSRQFIQKLNPLLTTGIFSTVVGNGSGTAPNLSPTAFLVDNCGQILLSGWTSQGSMPVTPDALQSTGGSGTTSNSISAYFYIMQLAPEAQRLVYGTYFGNGGSHVDGGTSRFDKRGIIYQAMCTTSGGNMPLSPNAWARTAGSTYNNLAFKMDVLQLNANFVPATTPTSTIRQANLCAPAQFYFNRPTSAGTSILWNFGNGQTSTQANNVAVTYPNPGRYGVRLTVSDNSGCLQSITSVDTVVVYAVPQPRVDPASRQTICIGASVTLTATNLVMNTPTAVYTWTAPGQPARTGASIQVTPTVTTKYTVTLATPAAQGSCSATDTVTVHVINRPALNPSILPSLSATGTVRQTIACAPAQFYFSQPTVMGTTALWDFGNGQTSTQATGVSASYPNPGRYPVTLTVFSASSCQASVTVVDTVKVFAVPEPRVSPAAGRVICAGATATLSLAASGPAIPNATYTWTAPGEPTLTGASVQVSPRTTKKYTVTMTAPAAQGGCSGTDTVTVLVRRVLSPAFVPSLTPVGTVRQAAVCAPGQFYFTHAAEPGTTTLWDFGNGQSSTQATGVSATYPSAGRYPVRLTVSDPSSCQRQVTVVDTVVVYAVPQPRVSPASRQSICYNSTATLTATNLVTNTPNAVYTWTAPGQPTQTGASIQVKPLTTTRYTVTLASPAVDGGCSATDTVTVRVFDQLRVVASPARTICPGAATSLSVADFGPGATYTWTAPGQPTLSGQRVTASPTASVRYLVRIVDGNGCQGRDSVQVNIATRPVVAATVSEPNLIGSPVTFVNNTSGATSYRWDFGDNSPFSTEANPTHVYTTSPATPFQARLTALYGPDAGCEESIIVPVKVRSFDLPNIITPNGDGKNDSFRPFVSTEKVSIQVFNRWGRMVFEQANYTDGWGDANTAPGMYYYRLVSASGASWKGWLEVVR